MTSAMQVTQTYRDPDGQKLCTLGVDVNTGDLIIGASNKLVKLSDNLIPKEKVSLKRTGVVSEALIPKAVLVDSYNEKVILCKSDSGSCSIHHLKNLNQLHYTHHKPLVPTDNLSNSLLFMQYENNRDQIYIVNDFIRTRNPNNVDTISSHKAKNLELVHTDEKGSTSLRVLKNVPDSFSVQYIYGFSQGKFVYFISNQPKTFDSNSSVVSKIARLCSEDKYYRSYVEIQLDFLANSATQYPRATAAQYNPENGKLHVGFSHSRSPGSAVCVFDLVDIDNRMEQSIRLCYQGNGVIGPAHFQKRRSCVQTVSITKKKKKTIISQRFR